jgi:hypothetical protein
MTLPARFLLISLLASLAAGLYLSAFGPAAAAQPFTVTVVPKQAAFPAGADAAFSVRVEGQTSALPSFVYSIEGGSLSGVLPPNPVAANVAEGTVFVNRATPGTARLTVSFAGEVLATAEARFGAVGQLRVQATLDAGPDAAARTWRYEVVDTSGQVVSTLSLSTSGDAVTGVASTGAIPYGSYTVRQLLGGDTRTACVPGAFYEVTAPAGAATTIQLSQDETTVAFTIRPCPDLPTSLEVQVPVDTITPGSGGGVVGEADFLPGEEPINEVRGAREPGPAANRPLPPGTGNTLSGTRSSSSISLLLLVTGAAVMSLSPLAWSAGRASGRPNR